MFSGLMSRWTMPASCAHHGAWRRIHKQRGDRRMFGRMTFGELGEPKVKHLHVAVMPDHYVFRLDVAMDDAGFVCGGKGVGNFNRNIQRVAELHPALAHE